MFTFPNKIICVTNRRLCRRSLIEQMDVLAAYGVKKVILREKDLSEDEYLRLAESVLSRCEVLGIECTLHSFPSAARKLGCKRLHMPLPLLTPEITEEFEVVGSSVHSLEQALKAYRLGADYVTAGHIFATDCKKGLAPRGLEFLKSVCENIDIPVYAIGGISEENIKQVLDCGAAGACIMSGLMKL